MSSQIIPLKGCTDFRGPAEFQPQRLFAFELRSAPTGGRCRLGGSRCR